MSRTKKTELPHYELLYIVSNKFTEDETAPIAEKIEKIITENSGEITHSDKWGKKKFAYPINHFNHGYYFLLEFDLPGEKLELVDTEIKHMVEIIRHLTISKKKRSPEQIEKEKQIMERQARQAKERMESEEQPQKTETARPKVSDRKNEEKPLEKKPETKETKREESEIKEEKKPEEKKEKTTEEKKNKKSDVNLEKLDEKLDKILDTDDLL